MVGCTCQKSPAAHHFFGIYCICLCIQITLGQKVIAGYDTSGFLYNQGQQSGKLLPLAFPALKLMRLATCVKALLPAPMIPWSSLCAGRGKERSILGNPFSPHLLLCS